MNTSLIYSGQLEIETKTKKAVAKNHGTSNLFRLFSVMLCKEDFKLRSLPTYFMLYESDYATILDNPETNAAAHQNKKLFRVYLDIQSNYSSFENNAHHANFISTVDSSILVSTQQLTSSTNLSLALVDADKKHILAVVEFDRDVYNIIRNGGQAVIRWSLTVSNVDEAAAEYVVNLLEE